MRAREALRAISHRPGLTASTISWMDSIKKFMSCYSFVSNKRRVANKRRVWKKYQKLINVGSETNGGSGIFIRLNKEIAENSHFFRFSPKFSMIFFEKNKHRVWNNCVGPGIFPQKE